MNMGSQTSRNLLRTTKRCSILTFAYLQQQGRLSKVVSVTREGDVASSSYLSQVNRLSQTHQIGSAPEIVPLEQWSLSAVLLDSSN